MKRKNNFDLTGSIAMQERKWVASVNILEPLKEITFHVYDTKAIMVEKKIICIASLRGRDLERFAVNILKALGSKKLALSQRYNSKDFFRKKKKLKQ